MKRFFGMIFCVSVFFAGLGAVVEKVGAKFKSDEKALALIRAARQAIGGDAAVSSIQSLRIKGTTNSTWKINGGEKTEPGETEIALQLPDKLSKTIKIGNGDGDNAAQLVNKRVETVVVRTENGDKAVTVGRGEGTGIGVGAEPGGRRIVIQKNDGTAGEPEGEESGNLIILSPEKRTGVAVTQGDAKRFREEVEKSEAFHQHMRQNELFRLTLALLLSPPGGIEANYTFGGE